MSWFSLNEGNSEQSDRIDGDNGVPGSGAVLRVDTLVQTECGQQRIEPMKVPRKRGEGETPPVGAPLRLSPSLLPSAIVAWWPGAFSS